MRGLPHLYRDVGAPVGTLLLLEISGECGGRWFLSKEVTGWHLVKSSDEEFASDDTAGVGLAYFYQRH